jgi:hypothetical protein
MLLMEVESSAPELVQPIGEVIFHKY